MTIVLLLVAVLVVAALLWDRQRRAPSPVRREAGTAAVPRFQGRGVVVPQAPSPPPRPVRAAGGPNADARFSGTVRIRPDAIGLACGRPIASCTRGADCLCRD